MNCPACKTPVARPADPLARIVPCPACGQPVDLASATEGGTELRTTPRMAPPADPLVGKDFAGGRYRIESLLGIGGMGRVYRATQRALGRAVAIKVLSPEFAKDEQFRRRFDREAGALASLEHPNIVTVHDVGVEGDTPYLVMTLVVGPKGEPTSLRNVLDAGPIDEEWALRLCQQTCAALEYAHARGVIHRDIKPGNILIDAEGRARIADFGIARVGGASEKSQLTTTGAVLGTLRYMAPEQMADSATADARSDLYSLGVVLYEMLTGDAPVGRFELPSETKRGLDARLDGIVDRALRRAATQRYQSAAEMARDLSRITTEREYGRLVGAGTSGAAGTAGAGKGGGGGGGTPSGAKPTVPASSAPSEPRAPAATAVSLARGRLLVLAAAGIAVAVGLFFVLRGSGGGSPAAPPSVAASGPTPSPEPTPKPDPKPDPKSDPKPEPKPEPKPDPKPAPTPPAPTPTPPPVVEPPAMGGTAPADDGLDEEDRAEIEDARKTILELLASGSGVPVEELESDDNVLPEAKNADPVGAVRAVKEALGLWKDGKGMAVADRIPETLLPALAKGQGTDARSVRRRLVAQRYLATRVDAFTTGTAVAVGGDWTLVRYDVTLANGSTAAQVAVCVREKGVWKVFL